MDRKPTILWQNRLLKVETSRSGKFGIFRVPPRHPRLPSIIPHPRRRSAQFSIFNSQFPVLFVSLPHRFATIHCSIGCKNYEAKNGGFLNPSNGWSLNINSKD